MAKKTVGQVLRAKRARLEMTLNQAEAFTNIQKTYIIALEQDDYDALPGDFYIRAYLKQYAERLTLDPDKLIAAYENGELIEVYEPVDYSDTYQFVKPSERVAESGTVSVQKKWQHYLPIIILGTTAVLIIIAIAAVVLLDKPETTSISDNLYQVSSLNKSVDDQGKSKKKTKIQETSTPRDIVTKKQEVKVTAQNQDVVATVKQATKPVAITLSAASDTSIWIGLTNSELTEGQATITESTPITTKLTADQTVLTFGKTAGLTVKVGDDIIDLSEIENQELPGTLTITIE